MSNRKAPLKLYANRSSAGLGAVLSCVLLVVWVNVCQTPPTPVGLYAWLDEQPTYTAFFVVVTTLLAAVVLVTIYWLVTPVPLLFADEDGMTIQAWPLIKRTVAWADVYSINAVKTSATVNLVRNVTLSLWIRLKPHSVAAYGGKSQLTWRLRQPLLSIPAEEVVRLLRAYHKVTYVGRGSSDEEF